VYKLDVEQGMRYDRIYLGACANAKSKYLYRLLEVGGVLVGPFQAGHMQQLRRVVRRTEAHFAVEVLNSVQFATLVEPTPVIMPTIESQGQEAAIEDSRPCGLKGVPFTFALRERPWALERNLSYPASFREAAQTLINGRPRDPFTSSLPPEIWADHVLPWCSRMWFEAKPPAPVSKQSKMRVALTFVAEVVKTRFRRRFSSASNDGDADSDGGSTRASSIDGSQGGPLRRRTSSMTSLGSISSESSPNELTLYEALGNGRSHAIGSTSDPDDMANEDRLGLLVSLLEHNFNTANTAEGEDEPAEEPPPRRFFQQVSPFRSIRRCIGWCRFLVPRHGRLPNTAHT
jgi:hypothetical protein